MHKPLSIFLMGYDWRNIFRTSFVELRDKLERDRLNPDLNEFFFFAWSHVSYVSLEGKYRTIHKKTRLSKIKPLLDLITLATLPLVVRKYRVRPDLWLVSDFGHVPAFWLAKKLFGGSLVMIVTNQPHVYSKTRSFGVIKSIYTWSLERLFYRVPEHFYTINQTMSDYLRRLGVPTSKITVFASDTIYRDREWIAKAQRGIIREKYNISAGVKIILTIGRLEAEKNYPELLQRFAGLGRGYVLLALGRGSLLTVLQQQANELGVADRVVFAGFVHRDEIWNYYADADAFVLLSKAEALGLVFWEAMHVGVPVVGSNADGIMETIGNNGERGCIWTEDLGQEGFNAQVRFCVTPSIERNAMIVRAKAYVEEQLRNGTTINDIPLLKK